jgi:hypothetical protein
MKSTIVIFYRIYLLTSCSGTDVNVSETSSQEIGKNERQNLEFWNFWRCYGWQDSIYLMITVTLLEPEMVILLEVQGHIKSQLAVHQTYFELTYSSQSDIIGSCYGNLKEELYFDTLMWVMSASKTATAHAWNIENKTDAR